MNRDDDRSRECISLAALDDYVSGELDDRAADALESALFDAAADGESLAFVDRLPTDATYLASRGTFHPGVTTRHAEALRASGRNVSWLDLEPGERLANVRLSADTEFMLVRAPVDLTGVHRIDVEVEVPGAGIIKTMRDIVFDPSDHALHACCEAPLARQGARAPSIWHCYAVEGTSRREILAMELRVELVDGPSSR